ncbi:MAG: putative lipid II flippase FtsW [Treponema sp.]|nr:putative lipid II flippase FtsW [Treponema sp.]
MLHYSFAADRPVEKYHKSDLGFFIGLLLLWGLGIFAMFVCSQNYATRAFNNPYHFLQRQLIYSGVGLILFLFFLFLDMKYIKRLVIFIVLFSVLLCLIVFIPPLSVERNGARRWLRLPFKMTFQPSELVKFSLVLFLANYFDKEFEKENEEDRSVFPCVVGFLIMVALVLFEKDFSTSAFLIIIGILMFFVAGAKLKWIWPFLVFAIPISILVITSEKYRIERILGYIRPNEGASTYNFQSIASKNAISAGGFWGVGIGPNLRRLNSIPEVQADYIFAGWAEAMGYIGVIAYLLLLCFFTWRGYRTAFKTPNRFAAYGSFGCISVIFLQSIINCMVVCGLLPSTGIPLPFFSGGGSSIVITLAMCGFVLNASRCEEKNEAFRQTAVINNDTFYTL